MTESEDTTVEVQIRVVLKGSMARKFAAIKAHYGFEQKADLCRMLITQEHDRLKKEGKVAT